MNFTRRNALLTGAATLATGAITAPIAIKAAGVKAALAGDPVIGLATQIKAAYRAHVEAHDTYEDIAHDAGYSTCDDWATTIGTTAHGERYSWDREEILAAATNPEHYRVRITPEERDRALADINANECKATQTRRGLGLDPLKDHAEWCEAHWRDLEARMLDTPALTVAGVLAKMRSWYEDDEIKVLREGGSGCDGLPLELTASIYRDLEGMAGGSGL